jgi:hypothetical protein
MPTPSIDFVFDGPELVTYVPLSGDPVGNVFALRRPLTQSRQRNVERYVELLVTDVVFHLDAAMLGETALAQGDSLFDAHSTTYSIAFVERQSMGKTIAVIGRPVS